MTIQKKQLNVAIIGGGISGLTTALALQKHCVDNVRITVYEQALEYKVFTIIRNRWKVV